MDLIDYIDDHRRWSRTTFGPGDHSKGLIEHIRKELVELEADTTDVEEWADIIILALDGMWRQGLTSKEICAELEAKQIKNKRREWPPWRDVPVDVPVEHIRTEEVVLVAPCSWCAPFGNCILSRCDECCCCGRVLEIEPF